MYVITGARGNVGNVVAKKLLAAGQQVRVIGRSADRLQPLADSGAEVFVCDLTDTEKLTEAFTGAHAVYAMIPPSVTSQDYRAYQERITDAIATAIEKAKVEYVVSLSSIGADKSERTGPIAGLRYLEQRLNEISNLNALHLRCGYFMENTLDQIGTIKAMGAAADSLRPDLKLPMIATRDIATTAAEALMSLDFNGKQTRELPGQRDISIVEASAIIGAAIGKPELTYVQLPDEELRAALTHHGMSSNVAGLILELSAALNSGHIVALENRSAENTPATSYETFVAEEFVPRYQGGSTAAAH